MSDTFPLLFEGGVAGPLFNYDENAEIANFLMYNQLKFLFNG